MTLSSALVLHLDNDNNFALLALLTFVKFSSRLASLRIFLALAASICGMRLPVSSAKADKLFSRFISTATATAVVVAVAVVAVFVLL